VRDLEFELSKFGPIQELKVNRLNDNRVKPEEKGKLFVKFINVASAFCCYNLLNGKPYLDKPVDILFINDI
jgi:hypothetical protein